MFFFLSFGSRSFACYKQLEGRKKDKEIITIVVCCNGNGSHKVPLWIISKYANLRCFKNKAWMTRLLFQEFVCWFDKRMNGRKALFLVDNCLAYAKIVEGLRNVKLFFLPPNTTSKIQSCDDEIGYEVGATRLEKINILNAINFINVAWNIDVKTTTIANCFQHGKIWLDEGIATEQQVGKDEGIHGSHEAIFGLHDKCKKLHLFGDLNIDISVRLEYILLFYSTSDYNHKNQTL
ncbi:hypothetical protein UlMin_044834 [Ulmus minor]